MAPQDTSSGDRSTRLEELRAWLDEAMTRAYGKPNIKRLGREISDLANSRVEGSGTPETMRNTLTQILSGRRKSMSVQMRADIAQVLGRTIDEIPALTRVGELRRDVDSLLPSKR